MLLLGSRGEPKGAKFRCCLLNRCLLNRCLDFGGCFRTTAIINPSQPPVRKIVAISVVLSYMCYSFFPASTLQSAEAAPKRERIFREGLSVTFPALERRANVCVMVTRMMRVADVLLEVVFTIKNSLLLWTVEAFFLSVTLYVVRRGIQHRAVQALSLDFPCCWMWATGPGGPGDVF